MSSIYNVKNSRIPNYVYNQNDRISTETFINKYPENFFHVKLPEKDDNQTILIFRPGKIDQLKLQNVFQLDSTHSTTYYGLYLTTLLGLDNKGHGIPLLQMISSSEKSENLKIFFDIISKELNIPAHHTLITDDYVAYINQWQAIFGKNVQHVLCRWHVEKNIKQRYGTGKSRSVFLALLYKITRAKNKKTFESLLKEIENLVTDEFWTYFNKNYVNRKEKWCAAFMTSKIWYNLHIESYHKTLKRNYFCTRNKRVDNLLFVLFKIHEDKQYENQRKFITNSYSNSHRKIHAIHHKSATYNFNIQRNSKAFLVTVFDTKVKM